MRIILTGGGSGGSVAPLIAIAEEIKSAHPKAHFLFIGGASGPEAGMAKRAKIPFVAIVSGKLRRYFSLKNLATPFLVIYGFFQSLRLIKSFLPQAAVGTGSFIQVPVLYAAWLLRVPVLIHQQDVRPSLANSLCSPIASKITVSFEESAKNFFQGLGVLEHRSPQKVFFTGNPYRKSVLEGTKEEAIKFFKLETNLPTMLVLGGGTGAKFINNLFAGHLKEFLKTVQIIHITGRGKMQEAHLPNYHPYEFMDRMDLAYAAADIVISRAGLSTITELSILGKVSIIIPMPNTHQEDNASLLYEREAAVVLHQNLLTAEGLAMLIRRLLFDFNLQKHLRENIKNIMPRGNAAEKIIKLLELS